MTRRQLVSWGLAGAAGVLLAACGRGETGAMGETDPAGGGTSASATGVSAAGDASGSAAAPGDARDATALGTLERGTQTDRGFEVDDVLRGTPAGDVHFSLHVPASYDGTTPHALYLHCPGWEGLWFQGVGAHLGEDFAFVANDYVPNMIVATPQLDDWGETSARKTVALTRWLLAAYDVDASRVYLSGYSGGGETVSLVMDEAPELYRRVLHLSSQWDGAGDALVAARVPVRLSVGESDDYYGSGPAREASAALRQKYLDAGATEDEAEELVVLDVKPASYFASYAGGGGQHGGGAALFAHDPDIMGWLFETK